MTSKLRAGARILQQDGPLSLAKRGSLHLLQQTAAGEEFVFNKSRAQLRQRMAAEDGLEDILDTILDVKPGYPPYQILTMQLRDELRAFAKLLEAYNPESVLEIGSAKGGSLYLWARHFDTVQSIISVDLPDGRFGGGYEQRKMDLFREFSPSAEMQFIRADSHAADTQEEVAAAVDGGVDLLFIDGDHTYEGVKQDFEMYRQFVADGGLIALHDIVPHPKSKAVVGDRRYTVVDIEERHLSWSSGHPDCNVNQFWTELADEYETEMIISHPQQTWAGIGVVYM